MQAVDRELMARSKLLRVQCAAPGCAEFGFFEYASLKERRGVSGKVWNCARHVEEAEVMTPSSTERTFTYVLKRIVNSFSPELYWVAEGENTGSGFAYGPGFRAFGADFPEGTRLTVTTVAEVPA